MWRYSLGFPFVKNRIFVNWLLVFYNRKFVNRMSRSRLNVEKNVSGPHRIITRQNTDAKAELSVSNPNVIVVKTVTSASKLKLIDHEKKHADKQKSSEQNNTMAYDQLYAVDMNITEPVSILKERAMKDLSIDSMEFSVWVLGKKQLSESATLQTECCTETGTVQVQFMLRDLPEGKRIDIVDVLKSSYDDTPTTITELTGHSKEATGCNTGPKFINTPVPGKWSTSEVFLQIRENLEIPEDPMQWSAEHVRHWLVWATDQFRVRGFDVKRWSVRGVRLFSLADGEFWRMMPADPDGLFALHCQILLKTNVAAVPYETSCLDSEVILIHPVSRRGQNVRQDIEQKAINSHGSQQQLWQFLLELLTDYKSQTLISWQGKAGEFRLHQPDYVATLWGHRKGKENMNYEKMSRALRYYYGADRTIAKVPNQRFVYRFTMDLKEVVGYSAAELKERVEICAKEQGCPVQCA